MTLGLAARARSLGIALVVALAVSSCGPAASTPTSAANRSAPSASGSEPSADQAASPGATPDALANVLPTLPPAAELERVPTRVRIASLGIDLPVVAAPGDPDHYPYCNVVEFMPLLSSPGRAGATVLYAHARKGMFLPILEASRVADGRSLIGAEVDVYSSDDRRFMYRIAEVRRHVTSLEFAYRATDEQVVLQTSEGPHGTPGKTVVIARPAGSSSPVAHADAHPTPRPVACGWS